MDLCTLFEKPTSVHFNGYCKEFDDFMVKAYSKALTCGCIIQTPFENPNAGNVEYFNSRLGSSFECNEKFFYDAMSRWIPTLSLHQTRLLSESMFKVFEQLRLSGKNISSLRNFYVKFMCWTYYRLTGVLSRLYTKDVPIVIYVGQYSTYVLRTLQVFNLCGCSIIYIDTNCDEQSYLKSDPRYECSTLHKFHSVEPFDSNWSIKSVIDSYSMAEKLSKAIGAQSNVIDVIVSDNEDLFSISKDTVTRLQVNGTSDSCHNFLYEYRESNPNVEVIDDVIKQASPAEIKIKNRNFKDITECLLALFEDVGVSDIRISTTFKKWFTKQVQSTQNINVSKCIGMFYVCMRYKALLAGGALFVFTNYMSATVRFLIELLSHFNVSIVLLNPNKDDVHLDGFALQELDSVSDANKFPTNKKIVSTTTIASRAESDIQGVLYSGEIGIFRDNQFTKAKVSYLNCTYEEIGILWNEELRMRQGFLVDGDTVIMPTIFAKLSGVPNGDSDKYCDTLNILREDSFLFEGSILEPSKITTYFAECSRNGKLSEEMIRNHNNYKYSYLRESVQTHLISKARDIFDLNIIKGIGKHSTENVVLSVILGLNQQFLNAIQDFDFTKRNPGLINIRTSSEQMSLEDTVLIAYLSLIGFDILLVVPTGYNVTSKYLNSELYKTYEFGNYKYDFKLDDYSRKSIFGKLFGRR